MTKYFLLAIILSTILLLPTHHTSASPYESIDFNFQNQQAGVLNSISSFFNTIFSNITQQSHAQTPDITTGLVGHWKFDEISGPTAGDSAGTNDGTLTNGPTWTTGQIGGALSFNGVGDYVDMGDVLDTSSGNFTIAAWVKPDTFGDYSIVSKRNNFAADEDGYSLKLASSGRYNIFLGDGTNGANDTSSVDDLIAGVFQHIVMTVDRTSDTMIGYVNGVNKFSVDTSSVTGSQSNAQSFTISSTNGSGRMMDGLIDDVRVYNRALTQADITELRNYTGGGQTCGNSIVEGTEQCDSGASNGACPATCSTSCSINSCGGDTQPPGLSNSSPTGTLPAGTTQTDITVDTGENAICRYSTTAGTAYSSMTPPTGETFSTTGAMSHSTNIPGLTDGTSYNYYIRCQDTAGNSNTTDYPISFSIDTPPVPDTTPPSTPTNLTATPVSSSQINLTWTASNDNVGVTGYRIRRDGVEITTVTGTSYSNTGLSASTIYSYTVSAYDAANNESSQSTSAQATTQAQSGNNHYIRSGATGADNGSDWTNAWTSFPAILVREDTYYIADGTYSGYTFNDSESAAERIYIKKAIESSHGTNTGWSNAYGDGAAQFTDELIFSTGYYDFNGQVGTFKNGHGFEVYITNTGNGITITAPSGNVTVKYTKLHKPDKDDPLYAGGRAFDVTIGDGDNITISHSYVLNFGLPYYLIRNSFVTVEYTVAQDNRSTPASHSECASIRYSDNLIFRYNWFEDMEGTGCIMSMQGNQSNWEIYGNVFYWTGDPTVSGFGVGIFADGGGFEGVTNAKFYNNTIVGLTNGFRSGLTFWGPTINLVSYNNLWFNSANVTNRAVNTSDYNYYSNSSFGGAEYTPEANSQITTIDPFVDSVNENFHLSTPTNDGMSLPSLYNQDIDGNTRGSDGIWDIGAYEYVSATLRADLNSDGIVNSIDWGIMNSAWGTADPTADINNDGIVNTLDWSIMNGEWS